MNNDAFFIQKDRIMVKFTFLLFLFTVIASGLIILKCNSKIMWKKLFARPYLAFYFSNLGWNNFTPKLASLSCVFKHRQNMSQIPFSCRSSELFCEPSSYGPKHRAFIVTSLAFWEDFRGQSSWPKHVSICNKPIETDRTTLPTWSRGFFIFLEAGNGLNQLLC